MFFVWVLVTVKISRESARPPSAGPLAGPDREGRPVWEVGQYNLAIYHSFT